jgi:hypothetical protein
LLRKIYNSQKHILFWVIYIGYSHVYQAIAYPNDTYPWTAWLLHYSSFIVVFYFSYFSSTKFFNNKKHLNFLTISYFLAGILLIFGLQTIKYYYIFGQKTFYFGNYILLFGEVFLIITFAIFFSLIEFTEKLNLAMVTNLKTKNEKALLLNKSKRKKELLIRNLETIVIDNEAEEMTPELEEFRLLVDFLLNSTHKALIPIALEIENLKRYIHLYQMRSGNSNLFQLNITGEITELQIPHKTILTLIENAIKHGDLDSQVFINISFNTKQVKIQVRNQVKAKPNAIESTNIGLDNLKTRLKLHLRGRYSFEVIESGDWFEVVVLVGD